jgi:arsenate reductase
MAESFFNSRARGKAKATSGGTKPSKEINPNAVAVMREVGIDISRQKPKPLMTTIIMGCGADICPTFSVESEDWQIEDPSGKSLEKFREIRDKIQKRVETLIRELGLE